MVITRSMALSTSEKKQKYLKGVKVLIKVLKTTENRSTKPQRRKDLISLFEFLNTDGLRTLSISGYEGDFINVALAKTDSMTVELNKEIADQSTSVRLLTLDHKLLGLLETCRQEFTAHKSSVL
tara:strand:- start:176 stop:547 length:372 start_codon:yes stop_codon:yes gene_type:complete